MFIIYYYKFIIFKFFKKIINSKFGTISDLEKIENCCRNLRNSFSQISNRKNIYFFKSEIEKNLQRNFKLNNQWWNLVYKLYLDYDHENYSKLVNETKKINYDVLSSCSWILLYGLFLRLGFIEVAFYLRHKSQEVLLNSNINNLNQVEKIKLGACYFEMSKFSQAFEIWDSLKDKKIYKLYSKLFNKKLYKNFRHHEIESEYEISEYSKFLEKKSIAIIGPAKSILKENYNDHDILIKFNHKDYPNKLDELTQISYYNGSQTEYIIAKLNSNFPNTLLWVNFKTHGFTRLIKKNNNIKSKIRTNIDLGPFLYNGELNMLPYVMADLIYCGANKISIYNNDLMLSKGRAEDYYPKTKSYQVNDIEKFRKLSVLHDPITQFKFLYNLNKCGADISGSITSILKLDILEYVKELDKLYGLQNQK